jgi:hypothetical protein
MADDEADYTRPRGDTGVGCSTPFSTTSAALVVVAMRAQVLVEQEVLDHFAEGAVVGDALVEVEVGVDDLLDDLFDLVVEREPYVLAGVGAGRGIERRIAVEFPRARSPNVAGP